MSELADRAEIQELTARYNRAADDGDGDALAGIFTPDGSMSMTSGDIGRAFAGSDELRAMVAGREPGTTMHATMDSIIELHGDDASQTCTLLLLRRSRDEGTTSFRTGRYNDRLQRTPDGWRFVERRVVIDGANEALMPLASA
jgi:hypothetical protein